ncbi:MAG: SRPBCC family protein [Bacteroidota bacterium]
MKKVLYVLLGLVALYFILCVFGPGHVKVERSIDINASADAVKAHLADYHFFHEKWSPWTEKDPGMKTIYTGEVGQEGHSIAWESDKKDVGKGSMTYKGTHGDTVMHTLSFEGQGDAKIYHVVVANGDASKATWVMESETPFMFRAIMLFMNMDKMLGPDFEKGLANLKTAMEAMPADATVQYNVQEINWEAKTFYGKKETLSFDKLPAFFGSSYGKIGEALGKAKAQPIGMPKAIFFSFDEKAMITEVAAVMEVANGTKLEGVEKFETPAGKVLKIEYFGAYEKSANAHYAMDAYMKEKGLTQTYVIEDYVTDPGTEKDTAKWQTDIFYLVK